MAKMDWDKANKQQSIKRYGFEPAFLVIGRDGNKVSSNKSHGIKRKRKPTKADKKISMLWNLVYSELIGSPVSYVPAFVRRHPEFIEKFPTPFDWSHKQSEYQSIRKKAQSRLKKKMAAGEKSHPKAVKIDFEAILPTRRQPPPKERKQAKAKQLPKPYTVKKEDLSPSLLRQAKSYKKRTIEKNNDQASVKAETGKKNKNKKKRSVRYSRNF